jgi:5'-3' exonuclease
MGDPTDGVPGVSKIGMKTAARLLNAYGDLPAVMAGAGILKTPLGERLHDLLALMGDPTNGVPGVSKIGMKTAARLLNAYGDLPAVMAGAGILKTPLGERLRAERDILEISRQLVELKTDVKLGVSWKMLAWDAS